MVERLFQEFSRLPQVEAIALGGSRAGEHYDEKSDYDVYVYVTSPIPEETRREILSRYCSVLEIGNHFWEYEDNCTLNNGVDIDLLWRDLDGFVAGVSAVVDGGQASNGYTAGCSGAPSPPMRPRLQRRCAGGTRSASTTGRRNFSPPTLTSSTP